MRARRIMDRDAFVVPGAVDVVPGKKGAKLVDWLLLDYYLFIPRFDLI